MIIASLLAELINLKSCILEHVADDDPEVLPTAEDLIEDVIALLQDIVTAGQARHDTDDLLDTQVEDIQEDEPQDTTDTPPGTPSSVE